MNKLLYPGIVLFSLIALMLVIVSCSSSEKIKIAVEGAYPPFSQTTSDGSIVGFDIDIANALCTEIDAECELVKQDWDGMIPGLLAKKYDAIIASMSITEERKEKVNFTDKYYSTPNSFIGRIGDTTPITDDLAATAEALRGKTIGVQQSTVSDNFVTDNFGGYADIKRYDTQEKVNLDLAAGRLDFVFADSVILIDFLNTAAGSDYESIGPNYTQEEWFGEGVGIAIRKEDTDLMNKFNDAIEAIRANGTYQEINDRYFSFDVYGE